MKVAKKVREKKCKFCGESFTPRYNSLQSVCSLKCSVEIAKKKTQKDKKEKKRAWRSYVRKEKEKLKTHSEWLKDLQKVFNTFIRERDKNKPCISCGSITGKRDAGHYRSVGSSPELRFNEMNVHAQCVPCNHHKHGNLIDYRIGLINRYGVEIVEELERRHEPLKLTIPEIREKIKEYRKKIKALK